MSSLGEFLSDELAEQFAKEVVSIPMFYGMTEEQVDKVINTINGYGLKKSLKR